MRQRSLFALALAAVAAAGCASRPVSAPVVDRRPAVALPPAPVAGALASQSSYTVRRGDTLYAIALEHGLDYRELAQWNRLDNPGRIREGQVLRLSAPAGSPAVSGTQASPATGTPVTQSAVPGEAAAQKSDEPAVAIGSVGRPAAIEARSLDSAPGAVPPQTAQSSADSTSAPPLPAVHAQAAVPVKSEPKALRLPYSKENLALLSKDDAAAAQRPAEPVPAKLDPQPPAKPDANAEDKGLVFIWPAKGRVIQPFNESANKGVDIDGRAGDPVYAAAHGRVMYTGTGIRGYGKLIVIKHDNGYNSVYAHNREILVKEGQSVARGERIAELGDSDADRPKLHFEIRKSGRPVDPMQYLESR